MPERDDEIVEPTADAAEGESEASVGSASSVVADASDEVPDASDQVPDAGAVVADAPAELAEPDAVLLEAHDLARAALIEITPESTVGAPAGHIVEEGGVLSLLFENRMRGYPGWYWTVTIARVEGAEPTVLEAELMPGEGALLAPDWVPWAERLAEYQAVQLVLEAERAAAGLDEASDDDIATGEGDESDDEAEDEDDSDDDDFEDLDAADFDSDGSPILHAGDVDGVDIDGLDEDADDDDDDDDDYDTEEELRGDD